MNRPTIWMPKASPGWNKTLHDYNRNRFMVVTHDRYFLDNVTNWILEIERGRGYPFEGNYSTSLEQRAETPAPGGERGKCASKGLAY